MVKAKAAESGSLHVNVEEKWRVQVSQNFCFFFTLYGSCKLMDNVLRNILYHTKKCDFFK